MKNKAWSAAPVSMFFATVGGIGYLPGGPGTYAAAVAVWPIVWMSYVFPPGVRLFILGIVTLLSVFWSEYAGKALQESDSSKIVIDEVVGVWVALVLFDSLRWPQWLMGFVAFRVFDIWKPWPVGWLDRRVQNGLGVVLDDVAAGLWAIVFVWCVTAFL